MARRRKTSARQEAEEEILSKGRWSGLRDQQAINELYRTPDENRLARERCRGLVGGGYGAVDWNGLITWDELLNDE